MGVGHTLGCALPQQVSPGLLAGNEAQGDHRPDRGGGRFTAALRLARALIEVTAAMSQGRLRRAAPERPISDGLGRGYT